MKKIFTLLAGALMALGITAQAADPELKLSGGSGTQADPFKISNKADVLELAQACAVPTSGTNGTNAGHYNDIYFIITADIDMTLAEGEVFYGIGSANPVDYAPGTTWKFGGHIDGQNHTIKNMVINAVTFDASDKVQTSGKGKSSINIGFIGGLAKMGSIKNLIFDKSCKVSGYQSVGMAVGWVETAAKDNEPVVENIINYGDVDCYYQNGGGIVGNAAGGGYAGTSTSGMTYYRLHIKNCYNAGQVRVNYMRAGGIIGGGDYVEITNCINTGDVLCEVFNAARTPGTAQYGGGIIGNTSYCEISNVLNMGKVVVDYTYAGGIAGYVSSYNTGSTPRVGHLFSAVNVGQLVFPATAAAGSIIGTTSTSATSVAVTENCYYNGQNSSYPPVSTFTSYEGITALTTAELTAGTALAGLSADNWTFTSGMYPYLTTFNNDDVKNLAKAYLIFAAGESAGNFKTKATAAPGCKLSTDTKEFIISADGTSVSPAEGLKAPVVGDVTITCGTASTGITLTYLPKFFEGEGTAESPYLISTKDDLMTLQKLTTGDDYMTHFENTYFKQTADIDIAGDKSFTGIAVKWTKVASDAYKKYYFSGNYDGNGKTIKGMDIVGVTFVESTGKPATVPNGSWQYVGFFGTLGNGAVVKNLNFDSSNKITNYYYTGTLAGYVYDGTTIENITSAAQIISYDGYAGGIAGYTISTAPKDDAPWTQVIRNCVFTGTIKSNYQYVGGIVGWNQGLIENCVSYGDIFNGAFDDHCLRVEGHTGYTSLWYVGGIVGYNAALAQNCLFAGKAFSQAGRIGGIAGNLTSTGRVYNSLSYGIVSSPETSSLGAIGGQNSNGTAAFQNCYYDSQLAGCDGIAFKPETEGITGLTTDVLTNGTIPAGLPAILTGNKGFYPIPAALANDPVAKAAAAAYLLLGKGETCGNVLTPVTVSTAMPFTVSLGEAGVGFEIKDGKIIPKSVEEITTNTVKLVNGDFSREFTLTLLPKVLPGEGTEASPYIIASAADFVKLGEYIQSSALNFDGSVFSITADLDFKDVTLVPVGIAQNPFQGVVKGNGKTIKNVTVPAVETLADGQSNIAIFAYTGANFKLNDLNIVNCNITGYGTSAIVVANLNGGAIDKVTIDKTSKITGLKGSGTNYGDKIAALVAVAGSGSSITNCVNNATVEGMKNVAGIVAVGPTFNTPGMIISNCENNATITSNAARTQSGPSSYTYPDVNGAGIAGYFNGQMTNCKNTGDIVSSTEHGKNIGGVIGYLAAAANSDVVANATKVSNCENTGNINGYQYAAGIAAYVNNNANSKGEVTIEKCINRGNITGDYNYPGGVAGYLTMSINIDQCANYGTVDSKVSTGAGGVVAWAYNKDCKITNCFNAGNVTAQGYVAGVAGNSGNVANIVENCFNIGDVTAFESSWQGAAGIANTSINVKNAYNLGTIKGNKNIAGIVGQWNTSELSISNVYNLGTILANGDETATLGNIVGYYQATGKGVVTNAFYCSEKALAMDKSYENVKHIEINQLFKAALGEGFVYNDNCLPMIKTLADLDIAKVNAVYFKLADGDYTDEITAPIQLGMLDGVKWTGENFEISGNTAYPSKVGKGTLTATIGDLSKSYTFDIMAVSGVDDIVIEGAEGDAQYYNLQGVKVANPTEGGVYIRVIGKKAEKVVYTK